MASSDYDIPSPAPTRAPSRRHAGMPKRYADEIVDFSSPVLQETKRQPARSSSNKKINAKDKGKDKRSGKTNGRGKGKARDNNTTPSRAPRGKPSLIEKLRASTAISTNSRLPTAMPLTSVQP